MTELGSVEAIRCNFYDVNALGTSVRAGTFERCTFHNCTFDRSALVVTFRECKFQRCFFRGVSSFTMQSCRSSHTKLFDLTGCSILGGSLHSCVIDAALVTEGTRRDYCRRITSRRDMAEAARKDQREPYEEAAFPRYRSAGELLETRRTGEAPRTGASKAAIRALRQARTRLPRYPHETRNAVTRLLRRPRTFGLSEPARRVLLGLLGVDEAVTGLVWPTLTWLARRTGLEAEQVEAGMVELQRRGWLHKWISTRDVDAAWIDYKHVEAHVRPPR